MNNLKLNVYLPWYNAPLALVELSSKQSLNLVENFDGFIQTVKTLNIITSTNLILQLWDKQTSSHGHSNMRKNVNLALLSTSVNPSQRGFKDN